MDDVLPVAGEHARPSDLLAIVIGIDRYGADFPRLQNAARDATSVARLLARHGYDVELLVDEQATCRRIEELFRTLPARMTSTHRVVIYFAGHGHAVPHPERVLQGYFLPCDAEWKDHKNFLPMEVLRSTCDELGRRFCRHLLVLLDCCFAGAFAHAVHRDVAAAPLFQEYFESLLSRRAYQLIASATQDQRALDAFGAKVASERLEDDRGGAPHSPFAQAVLDGLGDDAHADTNGDGVVTATELYVHIRSRLDDLFRRTRFQQTPNLWPLDWHDSGEFLFQVGPLKLAQPAELDAAQDPYRGLEPYEERDAQLFFGRKPITGTLVERVEHAPLTLVLGPSGVGKSSLVRAGLLPRLRAASPIGAEDGGVRWMIIGPLRPGGAPLRALEAALAAVGGAAGSGGTEPTLLVIDQLEELVTTGCDPAERSVFLRLLGLLADRRDELLSAALADLRGQLSLVPDAERRGGFPGLLALLARRNQLRVVVTVRSDYEPHFIDGLADPPLASHGLWREARFLVPAMNRDELRECIEKPAAERFLFFDPTPRASSAATPTREPKRLVETLLDDVEHMPGALPLLSVALSQMFLAHVSPLASPGTTPGSSKSEGRKLGWAEYDAIGGATGALQQSAERIYATAAQGTVGESEKQATLRRLMLRMVALEGGAIARRRVSYVELVHRDARENERIEELIGALDETRLIVGPRFLSPASSAVAAPEPEGYTEPAHDWLVNGWPRLLGWVGSEQARLQVHRRLTYAALEWHAERDPKKRQALLWGDDRILQAVSLVVPAAQPEVAAPPSRAGVRAAGRRLAAAARSYRESRFSTDFILRRVRPHTFNACESDFVEMSLTRRYKRFLVLLRALGVVITILVAAVIISFSQWRKAEVQRREAEVQRQEAEVQRQEAEARRREALARALASSAQSLALDPGARRLVTSTLLGIESLRRHATWEGDQAVRRGLALIPPEIPWSREQGPLKDLAFDREGQRAVIVTARGTAHVIDTDSGTLGAKLADEARGISLSRDGNRLAVTLRDRVLLFEDWRSGAVLGRELPVEGPLARAEVSPGGRWLVVTSGGSAALIAWERSEPERWLDPARPTSIRVGADDRTIVTRDQGGPWRVWDATTKQPGGPALGVEPGSGGRLVGVVDDSPNDARIQLEEPFVFSDDGEYIAAATTDHDVNAWRIKDWTATVRAPLRSFVHFNDSLGAAAFSVKHMLAAGLGFGSIVLYDLGEHGAQRLLLEPAAISVFQQPVRGIAFAPEGRRIFAVLGQGLLSRPAFPVADARMWQLADAKHPHDEEIATFETGQSSLGAIRFRPDGGLVATWGDGDVRVWDRRRNDEAFRWTMDRASTDIAASSFPLAWSPDSTLLAGANVDGRLDLWSVATGSAVTTIALVPHNPRVNVLRAQALRFTADGRRLVAIVNDGTLRSFATDTWREVGSLDCGEGAGMAALSADGRWVAVAGFTELRIIDVEHSTTRTIALGSRHVSALDIAAGGSPIVIADDQTVEVLSGDGTVVNTIPPQHSSATLGLINLALSPDGKLLAIAPSDGTVVIVDPRSSRSLLPETLRFDVSLEVLRFNHDGSSLAAAGVMGHVKIWAATGALLATPMHHDGEIADVAFSPDGRWLATAADGTVRVHRLRATELADEGCTRVRRNLRRSEWDLLVRDGPPRKTCAALLDPVR